jgi:hypothetical protein
MEDAFSYPQLVTDKAWDSWHRSLTAHAHKDMIYHLLDHHYKLSSANEQVVFNVQQIFMYVTFNDTVFTNRPRPL